MSNYRISPDVTFTVREDGILASNHRARTHVLLSMGLFRQLAGEQNNEPLHAVNLTTFTNLDNHFCDPSCLDLHFDLESVTEFEDCEEAITFLNNYFIVVDCDKTYREYFGKKQSILDRSKSGTFHQQLGFQLLLQKKLSPETLWEDNKIAAESGEVHGALYKYVQVPFIKNYLAKMDLAGKIVLDFGCGGGLVAELLVKSGAEVIGVDPDKIRLARAHEKIGDSFTPVLLDLDSSDPLSVLPELEFDFIWMSDVFLFYFYPPDACEPVVRPADLLKGLKLRLKNGGRLTFMEPHGCFWLAPWLGREDMPYTVLTEYSNRTYSVSPSLAELAGAIAEAGLRINRIYEPKPVDECLAVDRKAYHFAKNFPQWWVFELMK